MSHETTVLLTRSKRAAARAKRLQQWQAEAESLASKLNRAIDKGEAAQDKADAALAAAQALIARLAIVRSRIAAHTPAATTPSRRKR